jgi:hypothetical protein
MRRRGVSLSRATIASGVVLNGQGRWDRVGDRRCLMATPAGGVIVWSFRESSERACIVLCSITRSGEGFGGCTAQNIGARPPGRGHEVGSAMGRDWLGPEHG